MAEPDPQPCPGIPLTVEGELGEDACVRLMLAHAVRCPRCGDWVRRWRLQNGMLRHDRSGDPGE